MSRKLNFFAGPSTLPVEVLKKMEENIVDYKGAGLSLIEASHRGSLFEGMYNDCKDLFRELLGIPENYYIFFLGGGATLQFTMIPNAFLAKGKTADYIKSGTWSNKATEDAQKLGNVNVYFDGTASKFTTLPNPADVKPSKDSSYLYLCSNETIGGIEWQDFPDTGNVPLIADMSSDIFSRPVDVSKFGMIYGGVQKNLGPAGATFVILKKDMLDRLNPNLTAYMDYGLHAKKDGLYNTPPVFSIWGVKLVLDWIKENGGAEGMRERAIKKSKMVYDVIDNSDFFRSPVDPNFRSKMNLVFRLPNEDLEKEFVTKAQEAGMLGLKGHRSVGGLRASLYNALPIDAVETLTEFMKNFEKAHC